MGISKIPFKNQPKDCTDAEGGQQSDVKRGFVEADSFSALVHHKQRDRESGGKRKKRNCDHGTLETSLVVQNVLFDRRVDSESDQHRQQRAGKPTDLDRKVFSKIQFLTKMSRVICTLKKCPIFFLGLKKCQIFLSVF